MKIASNKGKIIKRSWLSEDATSMNNTHGFLNQCISTGVEVCCVDVSSPTLVNSSHLELKHVSLQFTVPFLTMLRSRLQRDSNPGRERNVWWHPLWCYRRHLAPVFDIMQYLY